MRPDAAIGHIISRRYRRRKDASLSQSQRRTASPSRHAVCLRALAYSHAANVKLEHASMVALWSACPRSADHVAPHAASDATRRNDTFTCGRMA